MGCLDIIRTKRGKRRKWSNWIYINFVSRARATYRLRLLVFVAYDLQSQNLFDAGLMAKMIPSYSLRDKEIHIWILRLDELSFKVHQLAGLISQEERRRASRFHFDSDRNRFILCRGILRRLLGGYLGVPPERLYFSYGAHGKPVLRNDLNTQLINFNISHSGEIGLFAFTHGREIGVDIEQLRYLTDMDLVARHFFAESERDLLGTLPQSQKTEAFFNCWVRKEAFIKATGSGLAWPLNGFEVSLSPGEPARFLSVAGDPEVATRWTVIDIRPGPGYVGAVVVQNQNPKICDLSLIKWQEQATRYSGCSLDGNANPWSLG